MPDLVIPGTKITTDELDTLGVVYTHSAQTITGEKTFQTLPVANDNPTNDNQLARKAYVDLVAQNAIKNIDWQDSVLSSTTTSPPASPSTGDRYLVPVGASGDWAGHDNEIAEWDGSAWAYTTPNEGFTVYVEDTSQVLIYVGTNWVPFTNVLPNAVLTDGSRAFTAPVAGVDPVNAQDLATKNYVDTHAGGTSPYIVLDPATDDIKTALENANDGDVFYIKSGTYTTSNTITISKKITILASRGFTLHLDGNSVENKVFDITDTGDLTAYDFTIEIAATTTGVRLANLARYSNVRFVNIRIVGVSGAPTYPDPYYIFYLNSLFEGELVLDRCRIEGTFSSQAIAGSGSSMAGSVILQNCFITISYFQLYWGNNITIMGCVFKDSRIRVSANATEGFKITNCLFIGNQTGDGLYITGKSIISNNVVIMNNAYRAIHVSGGKVIVSGNIIIAKDDGIFCTASGSSVVGNMVISEGNSGRGIQVYNASGCMVANNYIECNGSNTEPALEISGTGTNNVLLNNYIVGNSLTASTKRGIYVTTASNTIIGNIVYGDSLTTGIYINAARNTVSNNNVTVKNTSTAADCIYVSSSGTEVMITDNYINSGEGNAINFAGYDGIIKGNVITTDSSTTTTGISVTNTTGRNIITENRMYIISGSGFNVNTSIANTIIKNNIYHATSNTLPSDGVNGNIVKDNISY